MSFGLTIEKLMLIALIAVIFVGPTRLPQYASQLARLVRTARSWMLDARKRVREEVGPEFDEVDWKKLDPRQYDPRRIIREALIDAEDTPQARRARRLGGSPGAAEQRPADEG